MRKRVTTVVLHFSSFPATCFVLDSQQCLITLIVTLLTRLQSAEVLPVAIQRTVRGVLYSRGLQILFYRIKIPAF